MRVSATGCVERSAKPTVLLMETIFFGLIALGLLVYLIIAVLRPEKF